MVTLDLTNELTDEIQNVAKQAGVQFDKYVGNILKRHLYKRKISVSEPEAKLLQQINIGLPEPTWQRYYVLREKLAKHIMQPDEQQELIGITNEMEEANVHRVKALFNLAELRNTTVEALMDELKVRPPAYV